MSFLKDLGEARLSRRTFVGAAATAAGAAAATAVQAAPGVGAVFVPVAHADDGRMQVDSSKAANRSILYDATRCVGCHYCEGACKNANGLACKVQVNPLLLPETVLPSLMVPSAVKTAAKYLPDVTSDDRDATRWLRVVRVDDGAEESDARFMRHACTHCGLCAKVCPSGALHQRSDGIVDVDSTRCIGCKYCLQACPFNIPRYAAEGDDATIRKCTMCAGRVDEGGVPACVEACPCGALTFGALQDNVDAGVDEADALGAEAQLYGARELGGIGVVSVVDAAPQEYGLPALPT